LLFLYLALAAGRAQAYPQFQFSSGTNRCSQCHYSPAGGGLITSWGRDESGDTLSLGGDGAFLHGAWSPPSWLALGADFRLAGTRTTDGGQQSPQWAVFPMQADIYARLAFSDAVSLYLQGGLAGEARPNSDPTGARLSSISDRFISREHYLMWRPSATGPYARIGKFYAPYGIRFVEHIFFVRRFTGYNLYNETYNLSGGYVADDWELHVTAFTPPPYSSNPSDFSFPDALQSVGVRETGAAAYFEKRFNGMSALAVQARAGGGSESAHYQGGLIGKLWLEPVKMLVLGEADVIRTEVQASSAGETGFVSWLGPTFFPIRGLMVTAAYERYQEDLAASGTGRNAFDLEVNFFPWAHCEVVLLGRYLMVNTGTIDPSTGALLTNPVNGTLLMGQFHYYM
jgi:hypothetical protein